MGTSTQQLDKIAAEYHTNAAIPDMHIENLCQEYFNQWLLGRVDRTARVLELGYGDGLVTQALAGTGCDLTVIEGSRTLIDIAREKNPNTSCEFTLFEEYRPASKFDLILASHVLEHVDDPVATLRRISSWLREDGEVIIVVPNRNSIHRQLAVAMGLQPRLDTLSARDLVVGHQRVYSIQLLEEDVEAAGMRVTDSAGFFLKVLPNSMMLEYSTQLLTALNEISPSLPKEVLANIAIVAKRAAT